MASARSSASIQSYWDRAENKPAELPALGFAGGDRFGGTEAATSTASADSPPMERFNGYFNGFFFLSCFAHDQFDASFGSVDTDVSVGGGGGRAGRATLQGAFMQWLAAVDGRIAYSTGPSGASTANVGASAGSTSVHPVLMFANGTNGTYAEGQHRWIEDCTTPAPTSAPTSVPTADPTRIGDTKAPSTTPTSSPTRGEMEQVGVPRIPPFPCNANSEWPALTPPRQLLVISLHATCYTLLAQL
jgi:hypothetical protein